MWAKLVDKKVVPCTVEEWATQFEKPDDRIVKQTLFGSSRTEKKDKLEVNMVSTVFLGLNSGFMGKDLWFETMTFINGEGEEQDRYETYAEAVRGHDRAVKRMEKKLNQKGRPANEVESEMLVTILTQTGRRQIQV